ncbi:MAG: polyprenyl synthetase family protein [Candidatus Latescibacteria bacterium]|jgi:octaprenyl-diphosphate synthase|nr:polyprenyl synthetase family protein [Candidatus Latescibacterota bacterium]
MNLKNSANTVIIRDVYNDIGSNMISSEPLVDDILRQIFVQRGKGIRPIFMALVGELVGGSWESLRKGAVVIETIHNASLIHDDVVDKSRLRRGVETLNIKFSNRISVLFGDFVFMKALSLAHTIDIPEAVHIINVAIERMIEGEISESLTNEFIDEETYLKIIGNKTASLFAASGELAVLLSGVDGYKKDLARELGESVGMAFQIIDDTLDYNGETDVMGKPQFMDVISGNITLPVIHSLKRLPSDEVEALFANKKDSVNRITALVKRNDGIEYASEKAGEYVQNAREIIDRFEEKKTSAVFDEFFDMLMTRVC